LINAMPHWLQREALTLCREPERLEDEEEDTGCFFTGAF